MDFHLQGNYILIHGTWSDIIDYLEKKTVFATEAKERFHDFLYSCTYINLIKETAIQWIIGSFGLDKDNVLFKDDNFFIIIIPEKDFIQEKFFELKACLEKWLYSHFEGQIALGLCLRIVDKNSENFNVSELILASIKDAQTCFMTELRNNPRLLPGQGIICSICGRNAIFDKNYGFNVNQGLDEKKICSKCQFIMTFGDKVSGVSAASLKRHVCSENSIKYYGNFYFDDEKLVFKIESDSSFRLEWSFFESPGQKIFLPAALLNKYEIKNIEQCLSNFGILSLQIHFNTLNLNDINKEEAFNTSQFFKEWLGIKEKLMERVDSSLDEINSEDQGGVRDRIQGKVYPVYISSNEIFVAGTTGKLIDLSLIINEKINNDNIIKNLFYASGSIALRTGEKFNPYFLLKQARIGGFMPEGGLRILQRRVSWENIKLLKKSGMKLSEILSGDSKEFAIDG